MFTAPVFALSIKGAVNFFLFLIAVLCIFDYFFKCRNNVHFKNKLSPSDISLVICLCLPCISLILSQILRQKLELPSLDSASRLVICAFLGVYLLKEKIKLPEKKYHLSYSLAIIISAIAIYFSPDVVLNWGNRYATKHADPNAFGVYITALTAIALTLSLLSLQRLNFLGKLMSWLAVGIGIILAIGSQTRGAWLGLPILLIPSIYSLAKNHIFRVWLIVATFAAIAISTYFLNNTIADRVNSIYTLTSQAITSQEEVNSVTVRLSMWQLAIDIAKNEVLSGYGMHLPTNLVDQALADNNYNRVVKHVFIQAGPHNEYLANLLRSGIFGLISSLLIFFIPFALFIKLYINSKTKNFFATAGLAFTLSLIISALTIEVLTLKFTASLYGLTIVTLYILAKNYDGQ